MPATWRGRAPIEIGSWSSSLRHGIWMISFTGGPTVVLVLLRGRQRPAGSRGGDGPTDDPHQEHEEHEADRSQGGEGAAGAEGGRSAREQEREQAEAVPRGGPALDGVVHVEQ